MLMMKFRTALGKKVRRQVENEQLTHTYMHEKKKLEHEILKDNLKNEVTCKIMEMVDDGRESPRPSYKYERIRQKYSNTAGKRQRKVTVDSIINIENMEGKEKRS